ncbi:MAG: hypothetical protein CMH57_07055, partial [Myxococcales bacterium]|nr:hypothetical protein [Myxococcales bacterium]
MLLGAVFSASEARAADVTISVDTTYSSAQSIDTLTIANNTTLTLNGASVQATNLVMNSGSRIVFGSDDAVLNVTGTASIPGSSAHIEGDGKVTLRGGTWQITGSSSDVFGAEIDIDVANLQLCSSCTIDASERGGTSAVAGGGSASGTRGGGGGGYGGTGARGQSGGAGGAYHGAAMQPNLVGGGGGNGCGNAAGGRGGGKVRINVSSTFTLDGDVKANGARGLTASGCGGGGGAGGSIWVTTGTLAGGSGGQFLADGGYGGSSSYDGGGGGGGRIAVYYNTMTLSTPQSSSVTGGYGYSAGYGDVGTMVFVDRGTNVGSVADDSLYAYEGWRWEADDGNHVYANFEAYNSALVRGPDSNGQVLTFSGTYKLSNSADWYPNTHNVTLTTANFDMHSSSEIDARVDRASSANPSNSRELTLNVSGTLAMATGSRINVKKLTVTGAHSATLTGSARVDADEIQWSGANLTLDTSAQLNVDGRGFQPGERDGMGEGADHGSRGGGGGAHGGRGGNGQSGGGGGVWYDSSVGPVLAGAAGGTACGSSQGGRGGGIIRVQITGTLMLNGRMHASGANGQTVSNCGGGGGAGGSIWVTTNVMARSYNSAVEYMTARGGSGGSTSYDGGGGGGGRVLLEYTSLDATFTDAKKRYISVGGGYGASAAEGQSGTAALLDRDDVDLDIVESWRWQSADGPFTFRSVTTHRPLYTSYSTEVIRDDGNATTVTISGALTMNPGVHWRPTATTNISAATFSSNNGDIITDGDLNITLATSASISGSAVFEADALHIQGDGSWTLESGVVFRSPDMFLDDIGTVTLNGSSELEGNIRGEVANLRLTSSSARIDASEYGSLPGEGSSPGVSHGTRGGGGGAHGGFGGRGRSGGAGGTHYGSAKPPVLPGSGGGNGCGNAAGGRGGGTVHIIV